MELDDLSNHIDSVTPDAQVIPLLVSSNAEEVDLYGYIAAQHNVAEKLKVSMHQYILAFALTDYKLQGRSTHLRSNFPGLQAQLAARPLSADNERFDSRCQQHYPSSSSTFAGASSCRLWISVPSTY